MKQRKVFGIGLSKTGTHSLTTALTLLGYHALQCPDVTSIRANLEYYDAITDISVASVFRELDQWFPGSRFILTVRDMKSWLIATRRYFTRNSPPTLSHRELRLRVYGTEAWDADTFRNAYVSHHAGIAEHFSERREDLLIIDVVGGDGWEKLCRFLEEPIPIAPFPHENAGNYGQAACG